MYKNMNNWNKIDMLWTMLINHFVPVKVLKYDAANENFYFLYQHVYDLRGIKYILMK